MVAGVNMPMVDGLVLDGRRLWAVHFGNQVTRWWLTNDLTSGTKDKVIKDPRFAAPVAEASSTGGSPW